MKKKEIICAFYNPKLKHHTEYHSFMRVVIENREKIKPLYFEDDEGKFLIVFYKIKLKKIMNLFAGKELAYCKNIMNGKHRCCSKCGCGYLSYIPYTYRNNCGCGGRSYECEVCQLYSDSAVRKIRDYARKRGTKKALLKVLNGKFFKNANLAKDDDMCF